MKAFKGNMVHTPQSKAFECIENGIYRGGGRILRLIYAGTDKNIQERYIRGKRLKSHSDNNATKV